MLNSDPVAAEPRVAAFERRTQWPLAVLAVLFLVAWAWPILQPTMSDGTRALCEAANVVIWVLFGVEFLTRIYLAEHRGRYVWRHVPDVLMLALPVLRPLRLVRLLVLMRMINRRATASLRGRVAAYVVASAGLVLFCASLAVLEAERHNPGANITSFSDAVWWASATMTTVGYGDRYPTTTSGRAVGFGLMLAGIALLGAAGRRLWRAVVGAHELSPAESELLRQACRTVGVLDRLDVELLDEKLVVTGSTGQPRANPLLASSAEQRRTLAGLMRDLSLPMPDEITGKRRSPSATAAAQARWRERRSS